MIINNNIHINLIQDELIFQTNEFEKLLKKQAAKMFIEKKLYPNVDFYSGIIQRAIGIPTEMFTTIFALARSVGWLAQWQEMVEDPDFKIGRPRQLYTGYTSRDYVPIAKR